ncbi:MAG: SDR family NAD(P)-dependent oxidoreductase [Thermodesulfobacteriota bacterium]
MDQINLKGKTVFITGASSGIGKELSRCFAAEGASLVIASLEAEKDALNAWAESLRKAYTIDVRTITGDLSLADGPEKIYNQVKALAPAIDVLVNNAGTITFGPFYDTSAAAQDRVLAVNARAYMMLMRLFIPDMVSRGSGHVFNVSSVSAFVPTPRHAVYGATKAFVQSLSEAVALELKDTGVKVFTLNPGYTDTPLLKVQGFPEKLRFYRFAGKSTPATIAEKGVRAFLRGKRVYIPEPHLWFLFFVMNRFTPKRIINAISEMMVKGI